MISDLFKGAGGALLALVLALVVGLVFAAMWIFGVGMFERGTANFRGQTAETNRVLADPNYRIAAYEHFFDLCAAVQTSETRIANSRQALSEDPRDSEQWVQDRANLEAQENNRADLINTYNADAAKADTKAHFLASNLPYQLNQGTEHTTCAT